MTDDAATHHPTLHHRYLEIATDVVGRLAERNADAIGSAAETIADRMARGGRIFTFGAGHSGLVAQDVYYRAGGMKELRCLFDARLTLDFKPVAETSVAEKTEGLLDERLADLHFGAADTVVVISTSGVNAVPVDVARWARDRGGFVVAISGREYAERLAPRHSSQEKLADVADVVFENGSPYGDAVIDVSTEIAIASTSTVAGACLMQALVVATWEAARARGVDVPIYKSGNLPPTTT